MLKQLTQWVIGVFRAPSAEVLALRELEEAKRRLLEALSAREYADSMCNYHDERITRLSRYLNRSWQ